MAGDMFKFNGQTVSRAPGSKVFTGNLGGLSHADMYRTPRDSEGFYSGNYARKNGQDCAEGANWQGMPGVSGLTGVTSVEGATIMINLAWGTQDSVTNLAI